MKPERHSLRERAGKKPAGPLPTTRCHSCDYEMDCATAPDNAYLEPRPGDLSVCLNCGALLQFNDILVCGPLSETEFRALPADEQAQLNRIRQIILDRGKLKK